MNLTRILLSIFIESDQIGLNEGINNKPTKITCIKGLRKKVEHLNGKSDSKVFDLNTIGGVRLSKIFPHCEGS